MTREGKRTMDDRSFVKNAVRELAKTGFTGICQMWVKELGEGYKYESVWNALRTLAADGEVNCSSQGGANKVYGNSEQDEFEEREIVVRIHKSGQVSARWKMPTRL